MTTTARPDLRRQPQARRALSFASIVHVNEKGGSFGGTEEYIALVTSALAVRGVRSHLVCGAITGVLPPALSSVHVVEGLAARRARPDTGAAVAGVIAELEPDVIYLHNVFDPGAVAAVSALAGRGTLIWYVHDHYVTCLSELRWRRDIGPCPHRLGSGCLAAIQAGRCVLRHPARRRDDATLEERTRLSRSMRSADAVVVVSDYMRGLLVDAEPALHGRLHLLTRPIRPVGDGGSRPRERGDPAVVTYAGRITPEKGLALVIEALGATTANAAVELRIAGVIEDHDYWAVCRQLRAQAAVKNRHLTFTDLGHLDYGQIDEQFRQSDIVVIPSQWPEPLGAVALEAMSAGAAVVASRIGGLDTAIVDGRNGLLVEPAAVDVWAAAISGLIEDPHRARRIGRRARQDLGGVAIGDHLAALDRIVAQRRQGSPRLPVASDPH